MIDQEIFWGLSEVLWDGIFGFMSTIIVTSTVGFMTMNWLSKQEALNQQEGKILDKRITAYLEILDSMARMNEKIVILDTDHAIRDELSKYDIITLNDRPAVEYSPIFKSRRKLQEIIMNLDDFYNNKLQLVDIKSYKEFTYIYLYLSKLDGYYKYLSTTVLPDGKYLTEAAIDSILEDFLPKLGIVVDIDMIKMQADFEKTLVSELYKLKSLKRRPFKDENSKIEYFYLRLSETLYLINERQIFKMLVDITARKNGISLEVLEQHFKANDYVITPFLYEEEAGRNG